MKFAVVTCTGGRPELFLLCKRWVMRQTRQPDLWLVCSDVPGETEYSGLPPYAKWLRTPRRPEWYTGPGYLDPAWALTWALEQVPPEHAAVIMEDDDLYFAHHCEILMQHVERGSLISYGDEVWKFNLPLQRWSYRDGCDPTEGCVGIHPTAIRRYNEAMRVVPRWDPKDGIYRGHTKVDIKGVGYGLPGRAGATNQHVPTHKKARIMRPDPGNQRFRRFAGADADAYLSLIQKVPTCKT
jgi:hypothetical protein